MQRFALPASIQPLPYTPRLVLCGASCVGVAALTRFGHRHARAGAPRFLLVSPAAALLLALPFLFDATQDLLTLLVVLACLGWWATTRVLLVAAGRAPLSRSHPLHMYAAELLLPVVAQHNAAEAAPSFGTLATRCAGKLTLLAAVCAALTAPHPLFHVPLVRNAAYTLGMFGFLGALMDGPGSAAATLFGLRLSPHFNAPFLSTSIAEFWARRWNVTAATLLRRSVFDPVLEGRLVGDDVDHGAGGTQHDAARAPPRRSVALSRRAAAVCATFAVSGIAHEVIFWVATRSKPTFEWLLFFTLQGPLVILEAVIRHYAPLRSYIALPLSLLTLLLFGGWLFFPPAVRTGLDARVVDAIMRSVAALAPT